MDIKLIHKLSEKQLVEGVYTNHLAEGVQKVYELELHRRWNNKLFWSSIIVGLSSGLLGGLIDLIVKHI